VRPRKFWRDEYDGSVSPGWALTFLTAILMAIGVLSYWINDMHTFLTAILMAIGVLSYWINDMHMYHYGLFGSR